MNDKQKQKQLYKPLFTKGTPVEVQPDDEGFGGSWYEATVLSHSPQNPSPNSKAFNYHVQYKTLLADDEVTPLKERVGIESVRPLPPQRQQKEVVEFRLEDEVEAFHQDGWWIGMITKISKNDDDDKVFEVSFSNPPDRIQFKGSDLRIHLDWIDGKWVRPPPNSKSQQIKNWKLGKCEDQTIISMRRKGKSPKTKSQTSASPAEDKKRKSDIDTAERPERGLTVNQMSNQSKSEEKSSQKNKESPAKMVGESDGPGVSSSTKTPVSRKGKTLATNDQPDMPLSKRRRTKKADSSTDNVLKEVGTVGKEGGASNSSSSDTQPLSSLLAGVSLTRTVQNGGEVINPNNNSEAVTVEQNGGKIIDSNNQNVEVVTVADAAAANTAVKVNIIDPNNEKEKEGGVSAVEGKDTISSNNEKNEKRGRISAVEGNGAADTNKGKNEKERRVSTLEGNATDSNDQNLPFVKTFPLWKQIESMEVFQAIPQNPHFKMLVNACPENCREGMAIGYMVTFCSVVKKITELRFDDSKASIDDCLETLAKLEQNGFTVEVIYERLSSLLLKKDEYELLLNQLKEHESKISEHNCEKLKISEEVDELDKQIKDLQEKREMSLSMREEVQKELTCFELKFEAVQQEINNNLVAFKQAAAVPYGEKA